MRRSSRTFPSIPYINLNSQFPSPSPQFPDLTIHTTISPRLIIISTTFLNSALSSLSNQPLLRGHSPLPTSDPISHVHRKQITPLIEDLLQKLFLNIQTILYSYVSLTVREQDLKKVTHIQSRTRLLPNE